MRRIAIVGAGAAGIAAAHALTTQMAEEIELTLFDPDLKSEDKAARGMPYRMDDMNPLLNAPAHVMSISQKDQHRFAHWHARELGASISGHLYATRPTFGRYLRDELRLLDRMWGRREGLLHLVPYAAEKLVRGDFESFSVHTRSSVHSRFDDVILCPGRTATAGAPSTEGAQSAYPLGECIRQLRDAERTVILGTGLTAVDVARAVLVQGYKGQISMASRRGLLPNVRPDSRPDPPTVFTRHEVRSRASFSLRDMLEELMREATARQVDLTEPALRMAGRRTAADALRRGLAGFDEGWAGLMVAVADETMAEAWNAFDRSTRRHFLRSFHPFFQSWCNPMPRPTADLLACAVSSEQLAIHSGASRLDGTILRLVDGSRISGDVVVDARRAGQDHFVDNEHGIVSSMIDAGMARPSEFGGLDLDFTTSRVVDRQGTPQRIYAIGAIAQGSRYYVSALDGIVDAIQGAVAHMSDSHEVTSRT